MEKSNPKILVAEDNPISQEMIKFILERHGLECTVVEDGGQVISLLERETFDLILMDMQMPVMDGCEAARIIRESEKITGRHTGIRIIALTASDTEEDRQLCIDAGMNGYLTKPVDPDLMIAMIRSESELGSWQAMKPSINDSTGPATSNAAVMEHFVHGGTLPNIRMAGLFLKELPDTLAGIEHGVEHLEYHQLGRFAHRMAGAAAIIGAEQLALIAQELEACAKAKESPQMLHGLWGELKSSAVRLQEDLYELLGR